MFIVPVVIFVFAYGSPRFFEMRIIYHGHTVCDGKVSSGDTRSLWPPGHVALRKDRRTLQVLMAIDESTNSTLSSAEAAYKALSPGNESMFDQCETTVYPALHFTALRNSRWYITVRATAWHPYCLSLSLSLPVLPQWWL